MSFSKLSISRIMALACLAVLAACQAPSEQVDSVSPTAHQAVDPRLGPGEARYAIDPLRSWARIVVRRDGPLARFGHDHAIVARPEKGFVILDSRNPETGRAGFTVDVRALDVDPPEARAAHALDTQPDAEAIAGTRDNMLQHVFDAAQWPAVEVSVWTAGNDPEPTARAELRINGVANEVAFPLDLSWSETTVEARGAFTLRQQDWGLTPFSVLGGGLRVADELEVHFGIIAESE